MAQQISIYNCLQTNLIKKKKPSKVIIKKWSTYVQDAGLRLVIIESRALKAIKLT
jgi:hypothetical protein